MWQLICCISCESVVEPLCEVSGPERKTSLCTRLNVRTVSYEAVHYSDRAITIQTCLNRWMDSLNRNARVILLRTTRVEKIGEAPEEQCGCFNLLTRRFHNALAPLLHPVWPRVLTIPSAIKKIISRFGSWFLTEGFVFSLCNLSERNSVDHCWSNM